MGGGGNAFADRVLARARGLGRRLVLSEGDDERVREAARTLATGGIAAVTLLGGEDTRAWAAREAPAIHVRTPASDPSLDGVTRHLMARRPDRDTTSKAITEWLARAVNRPRELYARSGRCG